MNPESSGILYWNVQRLKYYSLKFTDELFAIKKGDRKILKSLIKEIRKIPATDVYSLEEVEKVLKI